MSRMNSYPRIAASAVSALAAAITTMLIAAAPAQADDFEHAIGHHIGRVAASHLLLAGELFFGPPIPVPVPVYVHHEVVYQQPYYVEHRSHRHGHGCGHGHKWHGRNHGRRHDRGDWDGDWKRGGHGKHGNSRHEVMHRGTRY